MNDDPRVAHDIDAEIGDHIERRIAELRRSGLSDAEARARAAREFGDVSDAKQTLMRIDARIARRRRGRPWTGLGQDLRAATRRLIAEPATSALTILIMALAIGVAAAVFTIVDQLILRAPPFPHPDRLVEVWHMTGPNGGGGNALQPQKILGWQEQPAVFERFESYAGAEIDLTGVERPERLSARVVSIGLFDMLGIEPYIGRLFLEQEGAPGSEKVVVLGHGFWRTRFGGSPDALGSRIVLNDEPHTVIGVLPRNTMLLTGDEPLWLPFNLRAWSTGPRLYNFYGVARLSEGVSVANAQQAVDRIAGELGVEQPLPGSWYLHVEKKQVAAVSSQSRSALMVLLAAVGLLLAIACVNTTTLALSQLLRRRAEIELRAAIGAGRWRLMREVFVETVLIAAAAGTAAVVIADVTLSALLATAPENFVFRATRAIEIDWRVLTVLGIATLLSGLLTGLLPGLRSSSVDLATSLRSQSRGSARGVSFNRGIGALIVLEVALSVLLLVGAALMARTLSAYYALDPGFDVEKLVTTRLALPSHRYPTGQSRREFFDALEARLRAQPGIEGAAYAWGIPPRTGLGIALPQVEGGEVGEEIEYAASAVSPAYFETTGTPLVAGRTFLSDESEGVAILSESFAKLLWPDGRAVGRRFRESPHDVWLTVVGLAGDVETRLQPDQVAPYMYLPYAVPRGAEAQPTAQFRRTYHERVLIVRAADPGAVASVVRDQVHALDPSQPVDDFVMASEIYADPVVQQRLLRLVMGVLAGIALLLVAMGIFGVLSRAVTQRRREIGIRVALGAGHARLIRMLVGRGLALAALGVLVGTGGALAGVRTLESLLFGVSPFDPVSFASVAVLMLGVALVACWWPTRRALAVEPAEVLRSE